jgi:hypothetical protein
MKASKFLGRAEGVSSEAGFQALRLRTLPESRNGLQPPEMRRLKKLDDENAKPTKLVAELCLDRQMLQDSFGVSFEAVVLFAVNRGLLQFPCSRSNSNGSNLARSSSTLARPLSLPKPYPTGVRPRIGRCCAPWETCSN